MSFPFHLHCVYLQRYSKVASITKGVHTVTIMFHKVLVSRWQWLLVTYSLLLSNEFNLVYRGSSGFEATGLEVVVSCWLVAVCGAEKDEVDPNALGEGD